MTMISVFPSRYQKSMKNILDLVPEGEGEAS